MVREWKDDAEIARDRRRARAALLPHAARRGPRGEPRLPRDHPPRVVHGRARHGLGRPRRRRRRGDDLARRARAGRCRTRTRAIPTRTRSTAGSVYQLRVRRARARRWWPTSRRAAPRRTSTSAVGPHQMFAPLLGVPYPGAHVPAAEAAARQRCAAPVAGRRHLPARTRPLQRQPRDPAPASSSTPAWTSTPEIAAHRAGAGPATSARSARSTPGAAPKRRSSPSRTSCTLYSTIGFTWYRLWARPFVPNIEAIPPAERAYYEELHVHDAAQPEQRGPRAATCCSASSPRSRGAGRRAHRRERLAARSTPPSPAWRRPRPASSAPGRPPSSRTSWCA